MSVKENKCGIALTEHKVYETERDWTCRQETSKKRKNGEAYRKRGEILMEIVREMMG